MTFPGLIYIPLLVALLGLGCGTGAPAQPETYPLSDMAYTSLQAVWEPIAPPVKTLAMIDDDSLQVTNQKCECARVRPSHFPSTSCPTTPCTCGHERNVHRPSRNDRALRISTPASFLSRLMCRTT